MITFHNKELPNWHLLFKETEKYFQMKQFQKFQMLAQIKTGKIIFSLKNSFYLSCNINVKKKACKEKGQKTFFKVSKMSLPVLSNKTHLLF